MILVGFMADICTASGQFFTDNFDSYTLNTWPSSNWTAQFNAVSDPSTNLVVTDPSGGDQALKLTNANYWAAFAFRAVTLPTSFRLEADVYEPSSNGSVGYQVIDLWTGNGTGSLQRLISFRGTNVYVLGDPTLSYAATFSGIFSFDTWHHITIDYVRGATTTVSFYVDSTYLGEWSTTGYGDAWDTNFHYLGLAQAEVGSYSGYFDNVSLSAVSVPPAPNVYHSADTSIDWKIGLLELTRVIELYNTRNGTNRSGRYLVQVGTEDGFKPDAVSTTNQTLSQYHSADSNRDGGIGLLELTRVIELYNYRVGTLRTGQYHVQAGTEDGFAAGT